MGTDAGEVFWLLCARISDFVRGECASVLCRYWVTMKVCCGESETKSRSDTLAR